MQSLNLCFASCFCLLLASSGLAQTTILGTAAGFEGSKIIASSYDNYITSTKKVIASTTVDLGGSFVLTLPKYHDKLVLLDLDFLEFQLFASEGPRYVVEIERYAPNSDQFALKVMDAPRNDLNKLIREFEEQYSNLADSLYASIVRKGNTRAVDSVFDALGDSTKKGTSSYMNTYVDFNIALIKQMTHRSKISKFEQAYIIDQPVRESNIAYMSFVNQYFSNYFEQLSMKMESNKFQAWVNNKNMGAILNEMAGDRRLVNDTLRELILIKGLYEVYNDDAYQEQMVLDLLDSVALNTVIEIHVELTENVKTTLTQLRKGYTAPKIILKNEMGEVVKVGDFEGKYVYISFWATTSVPSLLEMKVMPSLVKKYGEHVVFVYVSVDKEINTMDQFLKDQNLIIPENKSSEYYLHYGVHKSILSEYQVESVPHYVFLDRAGKIILAPAERPSGNIESMFNAELVNKKEGPSIANPGQY